MTQNHTNADDLSRLPQKNGQPRSTVSVIFGRIHPSTPGNYQKAKNCFKTRQDSEQGSLLHQERVADESVCMKVVEDIG